MLCGLKVVCGKARLRTTAVNAASATAATGLLFGSTLKLFANKFFSPPAIAAPERNEIGLVLPRFHTGNNHSLAASQAGGIFARVDRVE
jgi:hypothetical protein